MIGIKTSGQLCLQLVQSNNLLKRTTDASGIIFLDYPVWSKPDTELMAAQKSVSILVS